MSDWLTSALSYLPQWLSLQLAISGQPGFSVSIGLENEVVFDEAFGVANLDTDEPLTPRHRFRVASHSKTFTATGIMKLVEQGLLRLDDKLGHHLAGLHPAIADATVAQALSHTSGVIRDGLDAGQWQDRRPFLNEEELCAALAEPPILEANTRFKYSNHAFGLLGLVIEKVTGEPYRDWIAREIVAAAGLTEAVPDIELLPPDAPFSRGHGGRMLLGRDAVIPADNSTRALASATGFISTTADLVRFFSQLSPEAEKSLLSVGSRREMTRPQWRVLDSAAERSYGLGTISGSIGDWSWFGHSGGFQGVRSQTAVFPRQGLTISVASNSIAVFAPAASLFEGIARILQMFERHGAPSATLKDWSGRWWSLWEAIDLVALGDKVFVATPSQLNPFAEPSELVVTAPDQAKIVRAGGFMSHGETAALIRGADGKVEAVRIGGSKLLPQQAAAAELRAKYGSGKA